jgi:uncharacterized protein DUF1778
MDVTLTPKLEHLVQDLAVEDLRREIQKGLDQLDRGESVALDAEHIKSEGRRRLDRVERIRISERDSVRVLKLLENPPKPTKALLAAARRLAGK